MPGTADTVADRLFPSPAFPAVPVEGGGPAFPVHRIFCVGRNYAEHAKEMGSEVDRETPFYFTKSALALVASGATIPYPPGTANFHHEVELVLAIGAAAFRVDAAEAPGVIFGYAAGLDMTRRDLQLAERAKQRPWDLGKDFENAAVIAPITPAAGFAPGDQRISLTVNGAARQDGRLSDLVWSVGELISHLSRFYHLAPGDLLYTGTPAGVGPVVAGDVIRGEVEGLHPIELRIGAAE